MAVSILLSGISDARYRMKVVIDVIVDYIKLDYVTNDDLIMTAKIALAHLNEYPDYYN